MEEQISKSYYAIIPAPIRYDQELPPNAKLLYGEITALCNEQGFCWAKNDYFSNLYGVSEVSISKWVNALIKKNYIASEMVYKDGKTYRYLTIVYDGLKEKFNTPIKEKFNHNNTNTNNTNKENIIKESDKQTEAYDLWFAKIWEFYPRKVSKVLSRKTFIKKIKGMSYDNAYELAKKIYILLKKQIEQWQNENNGEGRKLEHTPHLSTWLNSNIEDSKG